MGGVQLDHNAAEALLACRFRQASKAIAFLVTTLGLVVVCGWAFHVPVLTYIQPTLQSMKVNTALSFLCLGAGLWLAGNDERQRSRSILGLLVVIIAGSTLAEYAFHISLGIDQLLIRDTRTPSLSAYPGRMAIATAICFLLLGSAVMFLGLKKALVLQRALVVACFAFSLVALCGYLYGAESLYSITSYSTIGVHTSAGLMAVCLAYFLARPNEGIASIAASDSNSGFVLRTLVPAIIVVPILIGWLKLAGQRANLYDTPFGTALQVLASIGCLAALTMLVARSMYRWECESSHSEKMIRESEARFRLVADTAPALIWTSGTNKLCTYVNKPWLEFTGRSIVFELGNGWAEGVHPEDLQRCLGNYTQSFDRRVKFRMEYRRRRHDGEYRWILDIGVPRFDQNRSFVGYIGIGVDVTERKVAEEALHELNRTLEGQTAELQSREELLKIFVKSAPVGVAMFDRDMRYLQVSDRWCADYGVDVSQILGRSHYEVFPDMPDRWKQVHARALEGETLRADEDLWDRKGGMKWIRWEVRPWLNTERLPGGILVFAEDITRRKQMEEAISRMSRNLIESQEQERTRIGRELHDDINQRLAMLAIELDQLQKNPSEVRSRVQKLQKQTIEISDDVQALSHELDSSKLEYFGAIGSMRSWCEEFGERQGIRVEFKSPEAKISIPREIGLCFFRVLQEALHNAAKYSGAKRIEVQLREDAGEIHLLISDLGRGFDLETAKEGRGLGLTSMQERVRLIKGIIAIQSKPMGGTTVHVRVPLMSEHSERAAG
jgi:PAS domain S-box-containing protein